MKTYPNSQCPFCKRKATSAKSTVEVVNGEERVVTVWRCKCKRYWTTYGKADA